MNAPSAASGTYRCTFTLPRELAVSVNRLAKQFRMSQSALLALLLEEPIEALDRLAALVPMPDAHGVQRVHPDQVRRLRGASGDALRKAVREAMAAAEEIDPSPGLDL